MLQQRIKDLTAMLMAGAVVMLSSGLLFAERLEFSENENRYLADFPVMKGESIISGKYMEDVSTYLSDHFPFRDFFMGIKTQAELLCGKKKINGIYIADEGYLIEEYVQPENTERIIQTLKKFSRKLNNEGVQLRLMLVPTAVWVYEDKLPEYAHPLNQIETAERIYTETGIPYIDPGRELSAYEGRESLYYKTDHHWTTLGAYKGYQAFCRDMGLEPVPLESMEAQVVAEDFCGTLFSKAGDYSRKGDRITVYTNLYDSIKVEYKDTGDVADSFYNLDYAGKKDKYSLFLNNLHALVEITNESADTDRELALVKDSYANSMVPFLAHHYKKIYVFDTRYYKEGPSAFIKEHPAIQDVLVLYNMNTLDTDAGIRGIY